MFQCDLSVHLELKHQRVDLFLVGFFWGFFLNIFICLRENGRYPSGMLMLQRISRTWGQRVWKRHEETEKCEV